MTTVSQAVLAAYMQAMMQAFAPASAPGRRLAEWLYYNQGVTGLDFRAAMAEAASDGAAPERPDLEKPLPPPLWQASERGARPDRERASAGAGRADGEHRGVCLCGRARSDRERAAALRPPHRLRRFVRSAVRQCGRDPRRGFDRPHGAVPRLRRRRSARPVAARAVAPPEPDRHAPTRSATASAISCRTGSCAPWRRRAAASPISSGS